MEWNLNLRSKWDWEVEMPKSLAFSNHENNGGCSFPGFEDRGGVVEEGFSDMVEEGSVLSGETIGLKLGRQTYNCRDKARQTMASFPFVPSSSCSPIVKRSRASYQSSQSPRCQVEGCNLDLVSAKDYHRRHRICADHSKSPKVVVAGMERRFCQQCSRLHDLSEFEDRKRSCRRRLYAHNARRRRPQSEDIQCSSTSRRSPMSFQVNRASIQSPNLNPQSSSNFRGGGVDMMSNGALSDSSTSFHGVTPRNTNHHCFEANSNSNYTMAVRQSFSLPVTSSWSFNGMEAPSSFDLFVHGHNISLTQLGMPLDLQNTHNDQLPPHDHFDYFCSD